MKTCSKCKSEKDITEFSNDKNSSDGKASQCKLCRKNYRDNNKIQQAKYYSLNKEKNNKNLIQYRLKNKDKNKSYQKIYQKKYYLENKKKKEKNYIINKDKIKKYQKEYRIKNKLVINELKNINRNIRRKNEPLYKLTSNIRTAISNYLKRNGFTKKSKTYQILGCSYEEFKQYLEAKFLPWMSWDNYGKYNGTEGYGWDIDHKVPLSSATTEQEIIKLNHHSNLQPLCSYLNRCIKRNIN